MNLFTATVNGKTQVGRIGEQDIFWYLKELRFEYATKDEYTDLTEVTVVPKDAVVIEGVTVEDMKHLGENSSFTITIGRDPKSGKVLKALRDALYPQLTPPPAEPKAVQYPPVSVSFFDHSKQEWVNKVGHIEHSGHFIYLEEVIHPNGGEGLKMYSVSPDNYHQMSSSEGV